MKLIKFDLPLNDTKVRNIEDLRDNFTTEILERHASGVLLKWLTNRNLMTEADKLSAIPADYDDVDKLVALCEIFGVEADRQVIEAVLSKDQVSQGVALREDPEELKYKEKYEKLSELVEGLKRNRLYLTRDDYNSFVRDKIQIEQEGKIVSVTLCKEIHERCNESSNIYHMNHDFFSYKEIGDVIEVGEAIGYFHRSGYSTSTIKSPLRGVLVEMGEITQQSSKYHDGDALCYIRVDHDTDPTIKIVSD